MVAFGGSMESVYTWADYVAFPDLPDGNDMVFTNKVEWVVAELWVSLPLTTMLNTSHSLDILQIMIGYIASICRISIDAWRDMRTGQPVWLTEPVLNS